jgi:hypothetical protein
MAQTLKSPPTIEQMVARILSAMAKAQSVRAAHGEVEALVADGLPKATLMTVLERCLEQVRATGCEKDEDSILDAMDRLSGWCAPGAKLNA